MNGFEWPFVARVAFELLVIITVAALVYAVAKDDTEP